MNNDFDDTLAKIYEADATQESVSEPWQIAENVDAGSRERKDAYNESSSCDKTWW